MYPYPVLCRMCAKDVCDPEYLLLDAPSPFDQNGRNVSELFGVKQVRSEAQVVDAHWFPTSRTPHIFLRAKLEEISTENKFCRKGYQVTFHCLFISKSFV